MKKLFAIITLVALAFPAFAQFIAGPHVAPALACPSAGFAIYDRVEGSNVTTLGYAPSFSLVGDNPLYMYLDWGSAAATAVSNVTFFFQYSADGTKWFGPAAVDAMSSMATLTNAGPGVGKKQYIRCANDMTVPHPNSILFTNLTPIRYFRLYNISNHVINDGAVSNTLFFTNFWFIQRE